MCVHTCSCVCVIKHYLRPLPSPPLPSPPLPTFLSSLPSPPLPTFLSSLPSPPFPPLSSPPLPSPPLSSLPSPHPPKSYITDKDARGSLILHKEWRTLAEPHPYDLTVTDIAAHAPEYKERGITLEELFKPKDQCFLVANPHYGSQTEVS